MQDILLFISVAAFMFLGFFVIGKAVNFMDENYKGFEMDEDEKEENAQQNIKNINKPL